MAYIAGNLIGAIPWILLFWLRRDLRKEMLVMSFVAAPLALFDIFFVPSYWIPQTFLNIPVGIEGLIFSFELGGISAVLYAELMQKRLVKIKHYHKHFFIVIVPVLLMNLPYLVHFYQMYNLYNIMICLYLALIIGAGLLLAFRKDLIPSFFSGMLLFGTLYFLLEAIYIALFPEVKIWFTLEGLPKIFVLNVPLAEIVFGYLLGGYWGVLYEFFFGYKYGKLKR